MSCSPPGRGWPWRANQLRLVVERVELTARATAEDDEDVPGAGRKVRGARGKRTGGVNRGSDGRQPRDARPEQTLGSEQMRQRDGPKTEAGIGQKRPPVEQRMRRDQWFHGGVVRG